MIGIKKERTCSYLPGGNLSSQKWDDKRCLGHLSRQHLSWCTFVQIIFYIILFQHFVDTTFLLSQKVLDRKFYWPQKNFGTQNNFRNQNFFEQTFFCRTFFLDKFFWEFLSVEIFPARTLRPPDNMIFSCWIDSLWLWSVLVVHWVCLIVVLNLKS